eukprot:CAMPEP_0168593120 /NCGR_PEP_ID=MMETSP0420-20121227/8122_1 /TAXON_ID=498008 /ORGANISM="Pessonella sp." /LENGTH=137 /DNA_ID=CAMNT_0008629205 /DNA_START=52 /DNA_END=462 /DNA_ORIENTATION=-
MSKRLQKEFKQCGSDELEWLKAELVGDSLYKWRVSFSGPEKSPYEKGTFKVLVDIPQEYPFKPPKFTFETKVYHPNVKTDSGEICTDILGDGWSPQLKIHEVLLTLKNLMAEPNPENPLEADIGTQYTNDRNAFIKT